MRQPIRGVANIGATTNTNWVGLFGSDIALFWTATEAIATAPWCVAGKIRKLRVSCITAPGGATAHVFALRVNGADSALTCTISGVATSATDLVNEVTLAPGDTLSLQRDATGGTPAGSYIFWSMEFESDNAGESGYQVWAAATNSAGAYEPLFFPYQRLLPSTSLVAAAGAITEYRVSQTVAPGGAASHTFVIQLNGVNQDGSGGTPDTRGTITGAATTVTVSGFTLNLVAGDAVTYECARVGGPAATRQQIGCKFIATVDGQSQFGLGPLSSGLLGNSATSFHGAGPTVTWETTEANATGQLSGAFWLWGPQVILSTATGAAKSRTFTLRKNGGDASPTPTVAIVNAGSGSDTSAANAAPYSDGDTYTVQHVPSGTPAGATVTMTFIASDRSPAAVPFAQAVFPASVHWPPAVVGY